MKMKTINDFFYESKIDGWDGLPTTEGNYLFNRIANLIPETYEVLGEDGTIETINLDFLRDTGSVAFKKWEQCEIDYFFRYSKDKVTSPLLDEIATIDDFFDDNMIYRHQIGRIAKIITRRYLDNWARAWYALNLKYIPTHNYSGREVSQIEGDKTTTRTPDLDTKTTGDNITDIANAQKQDATTTAGNNGVYGFNSSNSVPASTASQTTTPSNTLAQWSSQDTEVKAQGPANHQAVGRSKTAYDTNVNLSGSDTTVEDDDTIRTQTRCGNLGVTTTQQMLQSEIDFRIANDFYKIMFKNIDEILTCHCYGGEC